MQFSVITLFPELLESFLASGVVGRAVKNKHISVTLLNPREFTTDVHRTVDDRPFGGGPGMVMKAEPLIAAIEAAKTELPNAKVVYVSPQGKPLTQEWVREAQHHGGAQPEANVGVQTGTPNLVPLIVLAGRYEGIDERVIESHIDEEVSIGDYVLSGGEVAAMVIIDAVSRLVPGVLGHPASAEEDSFGNDGLLDCPHYTRPEQLGDRAVPSVLLSGDHKAVAKWRREAALIRTWERRPDLLPKATLSPSDELVLQQLSGRET
jgi:tRNA (guanine37-N1)-methyltransferase